MSDTPDLGKKHLFTQSNYLLDLEYLRGLEKSSPPDESKASAIELGEHFLKVVPIALVDLKKALAKVDKKALSKTCTRLKGDCTQMGASYMIDLCQQLETSIEDKNIALARTLGERLNDSFLVTRDQVLAYMSQSSKA